MNRNALDDIEGAKKTGRKIFVKTVLIGFLIAIFVGIPLGFGIGYFIGDLADSPKTDEKVDLVTTKDYSYKSISIELPNNFVKTIGKEWEESKTSKSFSRLDGKITQVLLQEDDLTKEASDNYSYYISVLVSYLKNDFEVLKETSFILNGIDSYKMSLRSIEYPDEYYYVYLIKNGMKIESIWMLTRKTEHTTENDLSLAEIEADAFAKTIKINNTNSKM